MRRRSTVLPDSTADDFDAVKETVDLLSKKWRPRIIYHLIENGETSFSQLKHSISDISNKMLSQSLKELTERGICKREERDQGKVVYSLTEKGRDMEKVLESIESWNEKYSDNAEKRKILIIEDNKQQAEMYKRWLEPGYDVKIATDKNQAFSKFSEDIDLIFLDRKLGEWRGEDILEDSDAIAGKDVVMITAVDPELDILDLDINDYLIKPVSKDDLKDKVNELRNNQKKDERARELLKLVSKKAAIDSRKSGEELEDDPRYQQMIERIEELRDDIDRDNGNIKEQMDRIGLKS